MSDTVVSLSHNKFTVDCRDISELKDKVVIYAHHTNDKKISRSVSSQLDNWNRLGWKIVVVDCSENIQLPWPDYVHTTIKRENIANDFGSWCVALHALPEIKFAKKVLLANSGMVGPFYPFDDLLDKFESSEDDVWGVTTSDEISWHIQSYWIGFSNNSLLNPVISNFWKNIKPIENKMEFIISYEIGFGSLIKENNISHGVAFPQELFPNCPGDPGLFYWVELLDMGRPFLRRRYINRLGLYEVLGRVGGYGQNIIDMVVESSSENLNSEV